MASRAPFGSVSAVFRRPTLSASATATSASASASNASPRRAFSSTPNLGARIIRRPRRPYSFTQLVQLSDGSTFTMRTTSPHAMYKATKDTRNHILWQPNDKSLQNVEVDEAGKLAAFRDRFGHGWDAEEDESAANATGAGQGNNKKKNTSSIDALGDLISGYSRPEDIPPPEKVYTPGKKK